MGVITFVSVRRHEPLAGMLAGVAILVRAYLFCHAGIALWAYQLPRPRFSRFHFVLYSGYLILLLTLLGFAANGSWQLLLERATWLVMIAHLALVSWSVGCRYGLPNNLKVVSVSAMIVLSGYLALISLSGRD